MRWITRERPKVDRVACPWLIRRFIDPAAEIIYAPAADVASEAKRRDATPFDIEGAELGHHGGECSFDAFVHRYRLKADPALAYVAKVIRGADTADKMLTPESVGVEAVLEGIRLVYAPDDHAQLAASAPVFDALYRYCQAKIATS